MYEVSDTFNTNVPRINVQNIRYTQHKCPKEICAIYQTHSTQIPPGKKCDVSDTLNTNVPRKCAVYQIHSTQMSPGNVLRIRHTQDKCPQGKLYDASDTFNTKVPRETCYMHPMGTVQAHSAVRSGVCRKLVTESWWALRAGSEPTSACWGGRWRREGPGTWCRSPPWWPPVTRPPRTDRRLKEHKHTYTKVSYAGVCRYLLFSSVWQESATEAVQGDEQGGLIVNIASCSKKKEKIVNMSNNNDKKQNNKKSTNVKTK